MKLFAWFFGKEEEPEPPARHHMTEEELYDRLAQHEEFQWAGAEREQQMMQAARARLRERRAPERRGW